MIIFRLPIMFARLLEARLSRRRNLRRDVPILLLRRGDQPDGLIHPRPDPRIARLPVDACHAHGLMSHGLLGLFGRRTDMVGSKHGLELAERIGEVGGRGRGLHVPDVEARANALFND